MIRYQRSASKSASSTTLVRPCVERRDDAVRRAGDPARIGRAPETIVRDGSRARSARSRGARPPPRARASHLSAVPVVPLVKCSSARSCGSVGGIVKSSVAASSRSSKSRVPGGRARQSVSAHEQHVLERRQLRPHRFDLPSVQRVGGHEHACPRDRQARHDRVGSEGREQRRIHAAVLERAERGHVEPGMRPASVATTSPLPTPSRRSTFAKRLVAPRGRRRCSRARSPVLLIHRSAARLPAAQPRGDRRPRGAMFRPRPPGRPSSSPSRRIPRELRPFALVVGQVWHGSPVDHASGWGTIASVDPEASTVAWPSI